jgi:hypothetical protein
MAGCKSKRNRPQVRALPGEEPPEIPPPVGVLDREQLGVVEEMSQIVAGAALDRLEGWLPPPENVTTGSAPVGSEPPYSAPMTASFPSPALR